MPRLGVVADEMVRFQVKRYGPTDAGCRWPGKGLSGGGIALLAILLLTPGFSGGPSTPVQAQEVAAAPAEGAPAPDPPPEGDSPAGDPASAPADPAAPPEGAGEAPPGETPPGDTPAEPPGVETPAEGEEPPPPAGLEQLEGEVQGLIQAKKYDDAVNKIQESPDLLASSPILLECLVEGMGNTGKPNWTIVQQRAEELNEGKGGNDPVANFWMGRALAEKAKPDLKKALEFLDKARKSKRAPPGAASTYWKVWAKANWALLLGVIAGLGVAGFAIRKKRRAAKAAAEAAALFQNGETTGDTAETPAVAAPAAGDAPTTEAPPPGKTVPPAAGKADDKTAPKAAGKAATKKAEAKPEPPPKAKEPPALKKPVAADPPQVSGGKIPVKLPPRPIPVAKVPAESEPETEPAPEAGSGMEAAPPPVEPPPSPAPTAGRTAAGRPAASRPAAAGPSLDELDLARAAQFQSMTDAPARPTIPGNVNVEALWEKLCRKAMSRPIPPLVETRTGRPAEPAGSPAEPAPGARPPSWRPEAPPLPEGGLPGSQGNPLDAMLADRFPTDLEVSIDLSESALRDDLLGKLKMLAITDGELRALLLQRNPDHIPHLIEYVMTKPDPVRLAFVAREIGHYHDPAMADVLASLLFHEDQRVQLGAIQGLQASGGGAAVLYLCPFLQSPIPLLAEAARSALSSFGPVRILEALVALPANPDDNLRSAGVFVLSRMRGDKVRELLATMLYDRSFDVRQQVMLAMSFQKDPYYLPILRDFFRKASELDKKMARKAIVYLQGFAPTPKPPPQLTQK